MDQAASAYLAALRCPIAMYGHTPGHGGVVEADLELPEGPDGEVAEFARRCPALPPGFASDPLVELAVDLTRRFEAWHKVLGTADEDRFRPNNAEHARRRRDLAETFWREGRHQEAIAQMLNALFLTWYEPDGGKRAMGTLAEWYGHIGNHVEARHAARLAE